MHDGVKSSEQLSKTELNKELDDALEGTFPASDPVSVGAATSSEPDRPFDRRPALLDKELVQQLADHVAAKQKKLEQSKA